MGRMKKTIGSAMMDLNRTGSVLISSCHAGEIFAAEHAGESLF